MFPDFNKLITQIETFISDVHKNFKQQFADNKLLHEKMDSLNAKFEALSKEITK